MPYKDKRKNQDCKNASFRRYYRKNRKAMIDRVRRRRLTEHGRELHRKTEARNRLKNPERAILNAARQRARKLGLPFDLTIENIIIPKLCPVLGIPLVFRVGHGSFQPDSPSLDRFRPARGYVQGNVAVISWRANKIKSNATLKEVKAIARWMEEMCP